MRVVYILPVFSTMPPHRAARSKGSPVENPDPDRQDRKSTRLNSSHQIISYAVFCLKKKTNDSFKHRKKPPTQAALEKPLSAHPDAPSHSARFYGPDRSTSFFLFNDTAPTEIYTLSLHDALPI